MERRYSRKLVFIEQQNFCFRCLAWLIKKIEPDSLVYYTSELVNIPAILPNGDPNPAYAPAEFAEVIIYGTHPYTETKH